MCGIYGIIGLNGRPPEDPRLQAMAQVIVHRGPDDQGDYRDRSLAMGMRRLSIIDVDGGHQPLFNEDRTIAVVCNGEIYNFRELRAELQRQGHSFRTLSDSEVIVHLYEEHGDAFVAKLDGMYGFALWDSNRQRLLVGRDRLGIKPLYVCQTGSELMFASELKSILAARGGRPTLCGTAVHEYLTWGYVPQPLTIFTGVQKLPPASLLSVDAATGTVRTHTYWSPDTTTDDSLTPKQWVERLRDQLERSVAAQMVSDVPLGAFLSGGIDSSTVVAMMSRHSPEPIRTYAIGFEGDGKAGSYYDETEFARTVANQFGTQHRDILVRPDVVGLLPRLLWHMDEPVADSAFITTYLVSEFASQDVTVILSGVGGDELFGGYRRYLGDHYGRWLNLVPASVRRRLLVPLMERLPSDRHSRLLNYLRYAKSLVLSHELSEEARYRDYVGVFSEELVHSVSRNPGSPSDALGSAFRATSASGVNRLMAVDLATQLPDDLLMLTDKMTMATSIECRVPLLDQALVDLALKMPPDQKVAGAKLKHVLKEAMRGILPDEILFRAKRGFGAPMGSWLRESLDPVASNLLGSASLEARGLFDPHSVAQLRERHARAQEDYSDHLQALTNLEIFARIHLDGRDPEDVALELRESMGEGGHAN